MKTELVRQLKGEEGEEPCVYPDEFGFATIGVGRLVDKRKPGAGLRPYEIDFLLQNDIDDRIDQLTRKFPWFQNLDDVRKGVLVCMAFQLGMDGLLEFKNTLSLIELGKFNEAAAAMLRSKWATQTPARAQRMAKQMATGVWQYAP